MHTSSINSIEKRLREEERSAVKQSQYLNENVQNLTFSGCCHSQSRSCIEHSIYNSNSICQSMKVPLGHLSSFLQEASHILMGAIAVHENKVCTTIPQEFRGEGTFVINCENLDRSDSNNDGLGMWGRPNGRNRYYGHSSCGLFARMDDGRGNLLPDAKYIWKCMMRRYEHPMTTSVNRGQNRFIKKVSYFIFFVVARFVVTFTASQLNACISQNGVMAALPATCSAYFGDCPLYAVGAIDFNAVASIILGGTIVEPSKICNKVPQGYRECGTFIIDLCNFVSDAELRRDDNGCWGKPAGNSRYYKIDSSTGDAVRVDRCCKLIEGAEYDVQILSKRYEHPLVNGRFVRKIYTARTPSNSR
ncbi:unnamed protein product [Haemonchus placei]|uniref:Clip domain-containing protein n=1 Tax=Haemonchus placei TaxID=6290 RepID=A0A0N4WNJ3_HAEPC|nr:unnamed protein product [Haemonchus placei]